MVNDVIKTSEDVMKSDKVTKNHVIETYENYREEDRLTTNQARKIEFLTTIRIFDEVFPKHAKILDCAAGTGIYTFALADREYEVTATDLTPRHVAIMDSIKKEKGYDIQTKVLDASDMSIFEDESFDIVLNMGPFYHLIDEHKRMKCLLECLRVLKKGGLLVTAYIPRYYIFQLLALNNDKYLDADFAKQLIQTGALHHDDENCFWTDSYYSSKEEMERLYCENGLRVTEHFAQDGLTPMFADKVDAWTEEEFAVWCEYHYSVCREKSVLGSSNHVVIIGEKQ